MKGRSAGFLGLAAALLAASACVDSSRVNQTCTWIEQSTQRLDPSNWADYQHLRADAQVAGELGVRLADIRYRQSPSLGDPVQRACTSAMTDTIARRHGLDRAQVLKAFDYRLWWADALAVYLPISVIVAFGMDLITRRVRRSFDPEDRWIAIASNAAFVPMVALMGLMAGQIWGFEVEGMFLRDAHVAFRASHIPITRHGWIAFFSLTALAAVVAVARCRTTALRIDEPGYSMRRRHS